MPFLKTATSASLLLIGCLSILIPGVAEAHKPLLHKNCWCDAVAVDGNQNITKIMSISTGLVFHVLAPTTGDRGDCNNKCGVLFDQNRTAIAAQACALNLPNGIDIRAAWWIGTQNVNQARNAPLQVKYGQKCPGNGWMSNTDNQIGGITFDGKCKGEYTLTWTPANPGLPALSPPPNGTPIGTWGFYWNNHLVVWGTAANNGAPGPASSANGKICTI